LKFGENKLINSFILVFYGRFKLNILNLHSRRFSIVLAVQLLLLLTLFYSRTTAIATSEPVIKIVDANTGSSNIPLGSETEPMPLGGYSFTVNVKLEGATNRLYTYQVAVGFDKTKVKCTAAWIPKNDPNFVFYGKTIITVSPRINLEWEPGFVAIGASLNLPTDYADVSGGILCQINFTAIKTGTSTLDIIRTGTSIIDGIRTKTITSRFNTFILDDNLRDIDFLGESCSMSVTAMPSPPVATFTFNPLNPKANQTVTFDASKSYDPDGTITSYVWDFGDGTKEIGVNAVTTHVFDKKGIYHVELTLIDNDGLCSSVTYDVLVGELPFVTFTYNPVEPWPYRGDTVTFDASGSSDPDGYITNYLWDFGDGTKEGTVNSVVTHVFDENGVYHVKLTLFDNDGLYSSTVQDVFVGIRPVADFTFSPENPNPDEEIIFDAYGNETHRFSYDPDGRIVHAIWDFGDLNAVEGDVSNPTDLVVVHTYIVQGGVYSVNLTVFDDDGLYTSVVRNVDVTVIQRPKVARIPWEEYATVGLVFGAIIAVAFKYRRRSEEESGIRDYKVF